MSTVTVLITVNYGEDIQILPTSLMHIVRDKIKQSKQTFLSNKKHIWSNTTTFTELPELHIGIFKIRHGRWCRVWAHQVPLLTQLRS